MKYNIEIFPANIEFKSESNILNDALEQSIHLEHSCKNGQCGSCEAKIINGDVIDQNGFLVNKGKILTCLSKAKSHLILEAKYYKELSDIQSMTSPCKVSSFQWLTEDILSLTLRLPPKNRLKYLSGQYIDLSVNGIKRSYSIANAMSEKGDIELQIRRVEGGAMSSFLRENLAINQLMRMEGPKGTFFVRESNKPLIFLATGTGIAPVKSMVEDLINKETKRQVHIYWGMRHENELYCRSLNELASHHSNVYFIPVLSRDEKWNGIKGHVQDAVLSDFDSLIDYEVYACGSINMILDAKEKLIKKELSENAFYFDAFTASR